MMTYTLMTKIMETSANMTKFHTTHMFTQNFVFRLLQAECDHFQPTQLSTSVSSR